MNNLGILFTSTGQPLEALRYYNLALPIRREVGNRAGEAVTLYNMARIHLDQGQTDQAVDLIRQVIEIDRLTGAAHSEADDLFFLATLLNQLGKPQEAIPLVQRSIALFHQHKLQQDDAGRSLAQHEQLLAALQSGAPPSQPTGLSNESLRVIRSNTITVMTKMSEKNAEWRATIVDALHQATSQAEQAFFQALLDPLDGQEPMLPEENPYASTLQTILAGIAAGGQPNQHQEELTPEVLEAVRTFLGTDSWADTRLVLEEKQALLFQPEVEALFQGLVDDARNKHDQQRAGYFQFHLSLLQDAKANGITTAFARLEATVQANHNGSVLSEDFIERAVRGLKGEVAEKMALLNWLAELTQQVPPPDQKLIDLLQRALFAQDLARMEVELDPPQRAVWDQILEGLQ